MLDHLLLNGDEKFKCINAVKTYCKLRAGKHAENISSRNLIYCHLDLKVPFL